MQMQRCEATSQLCWVFFLSFFRFKSPKELERTEQGASGRVDMEAPWRLLIQSELKGGSKMVFSITVIKIFSLVWHLDQRIGSG